MNIDYSRLNKQVNKVAKSKSFDEDVKELVSRYLNIPLDDFGDYKGLLKLNKYFYLFPVYIGIKKSEKFDLHTVFTNPEKNVLLRWWINYVEKLDDNFDRSKVILVFKKNYQPMLCLLLIDTFKELLSFVKVRVYIKSLITFESFEADEIFIICKFEDLLKERALEFSLDYKKGR